MIAVIINAVSVFISGIIGIKIGNQIPEKIQNTIVSIIGMAILIMGIDYGQKGSIILSIISMIIGTIIGELINIDGKLIIFGENFKKLFIKKSDDSKFVEGFVSSTLLFCVGSMAILGSLEAGISKNYDLILTKTLMDSIITVVLASSFGIGVALSSISIFIYQGTLTLLAELISPLFTQNVVDNISGVGGIMLLALSLQMLKIKNFKTANMLPALLVPIIYNWVLTLL